MGIKDQSFVDQVRQREKWRTAKQASRKRLRENGEVDISKRRDLRTRLDLETEGQVLLDFLRGMSYLDLAQKYNIGSTTVTRILEYWKQQIFSRFRNIDILIHPAEEKTMNPSPPEKEDNSDSFF